MQLPKAISEVPRAFDRLLRLRPIQAWALILLCMDVAALGDLLTGPDLWFGPVYLSVICLASWSLGWRAGLATGVACMLLAFAINGIHLYPYGGADLIANMGMRFVAVSIVVAMVAGVRRAYVREWWLARTDPLTGALNRQAFFELGTSAVDSRSWRLLLYADLDGLKQINDLQGHAAGDTGLRSFSAEIKKNTRQHDIFARVGGDEFLVFMAVRDEASARAVAQRLHGAMNNIADGNGARLRSSVGALLVPPGEWSIDDLVCRADNLMYDAKLRGACLELAVASDAKRETAAGRARWLGRAPGSAPPAGKTSLPERRTPSRASFTPQRAPF